MNPGSSSELCDLEQVASLLWALDSASTKQGVFALLDIGLVLTREDGPRESQQVVSRADPDGK